MKNKWKKLLAGTLATAMVMGMLCVGTLAAEEELEPTSAETIEQVEEKQEVLETEETEEVGADLPQDAEEAEEVEETVENEEFSDDVTPVADEEPCAHNWVYDHCWMATGAKLPNCQTAHTDVYRCTECSETENRNGKTHSHVMVYEDMNRFSHNAKCELCVWSEPYRDHKYSDPTCTVPATCVCGRTQGDVDPDNHVHQEPIEGEDATCTEDGWTEGVRCVDCGEVLKEREVIKANGHTEVTDEAVDATCARPGKTEGSHCSVCNTVLVAQKETELAPHKWNEGVVTKEPTVEEDGEMTFTCGECEATKTEPIDKLEPKVVAKIVRDGEDVTFTTLQAAVNAATEKETVILLENVTENVIVNGKTIALDLGGKVVTGTGGETGDKYNNMTYGTVLTIKGKSDVTLMNGTITGGNSTGLSSGGGVTLTGGSKLAVKKVTITKNTTERYGGGIYAATGTTLTIEESNISENGAGSQGGGIYSTGNNTITMNNNEIRGNTAKYNGGAISVSAYNTQATLTMSGNQISENEANSGGGSGNGGGFYLYGGVAVHMAGDVISGNTAAVSGGGIYMTSGAVVIMDNGTICNNTADTSAADVYAYDSTITLPDAAQMEAELGDTAKAITGWYKDEQSPVNGPSKRWGAVVEEVTEVKEVTTTGALALIAAYDPRTWYTVTYTDGVENAEIFADQVVRVVDGAATPAYEGTPSRTGYTFTGWNPTVAETVTADVTYTAQWTRTSGGGSTGGGDDNDDRPARPTPTPTPIETPEETPDIVETLPEEDVPLAETPVELETLTDEEVPLGETPNMEEGFENLGELEVPLAEVPKTGDSTGLWMVMAICSLLGLAYLGRKKEA